MEGSFSEMSSSRSVGTVTSIRALREDMGVGGSGGALDEGSSGLSKSPRSSGLGVVLLSLIVKAVRTDVSIWAMLRLVVWGPPSPRPSSPASMQVDSRRELESSNWRSRSSR